MDFRWGLLVYCVFFKVWLSLDYRLRNLYITSSKETNHVLWSSVIATNELVAQQPGEWTCDGNSCFKFSIWLCKCICWDSFFHFGMLSLVFHLFWTYSSILLYFYAWKRCKTSLSEKNYVVTIFSQLWCFLIFLIAVVTESKDTQRFWRVLLKASVLWGFSKISLGKLPMIFQMNLCGMILSRWSFRQLRQPATFPGI